METPANGRRVLRSLFNHIALPAQLPQQQESNIGDIESALVSHLIYVVKAMRDAQEGKYREVWDSLRRTLQSCKTLNIGGRLERTQLMSHLRQMQISDLIILHIATQNAGIYIHKPAE